MKKKYISRILAAILSFSICIFAISGCIKGTGDDKDEDESSDKSDEKANEESGKEKRVLLISIDGLRADAIENTEYGRYLLENSAYSLEVTTVTPSITLPCHMSMFHSVTPEAHGVTANVYTPSESLGYGITEALKEGGKTSAIFYNWKEIGHLVTEGSTENAKYIAGETEGWEEANAMIGEACIEHILNTPTDFTFLYLGFLDEWGHANGWLSEKYYYALNESFSLIERVIEAAKVQNYTVIITSDHGGHDFTHGSEMKEDMTIPLFIIGDGFERGSSLGPRSILDVAPTVAKIIGTPAPDYWQGKAVN